MRISFMETDNHKFDAGITNLELFSTTSVQWTSLIAMKRSEVAKGNVC